MDAYEAIAVIADAPSDGIDTLQAIEAKGWGDVRRNPKMVKAILSLIDAKKTQTETAKALGINQSTVSRVLAEYADCSQIAVRLAKAKSIEAIESCIRAMPAAEKLGKHGPQEAVLKVAGVLKSENEHGPAVLVQIGADVRDVQIAGQSVIDVLPE